MTVLRGTPLKSWLAIWLAVVRKILERDPGGERRRARLNRLTLLLCFQLVGEKGLLTGKGSEYDARMGETINHRKCN